MRSVNRAITVWSTRNWSAFCRNSGLPRPRSPVFTRECATSFSARVIRASAPEIIGTGFWNEAMPLVRYRTDDIVIVPDSYAPSDLDDVTLGLKPVAAIRRRGQGASGGL